MEDAKETSASDAEAKAPPSTPTKEIEPVTTDEENKPAKKDRRRSESFVHFPRFRVTWDSTVPSLMSLKSSPGKKKRRNSHSAMVERPGVLMYVMHSLILSLKDF